jgi:hypothetical protein
VDYLGHRPKSLVDWEQQGECKENRVTFFHMLPSRPVCRNPQQQST